MSRAYPYNLAWVQERAAGLDPIFVPRAANRYFLGLGVTSRCNFNCPSCYYHGPEERDAGSDMPYSMLAKILSALPRLAGIIFGLEGEPLLHPDILPMLRLAARHAQTISIITNGSIVTRELCDVLAELPLCRIFLSIDAADEKLYARLRRGGKFDKFLGNAAMLGEVCECMPHATVYAQNLRSLINLSSLARRLGMKCVSFQQLRVHPGAVARGLSPAGTDELSGWLLEVLEKARENNIGIMLDRFFGGPQMRKPLLEMREKYPFLILQEYKRGACAHADTLAGITSSGLLFPCAGDFSPAPLQQISFDSIFNHPYLTALRALHKAEIISGACRICMNCIE